MKSRKLGLRILSLFFAIVSVIYLMPIVVVAYNSFKENGAINLDTFALPNETTFMGWSNYTNGMTFGIQLCHHHSLRRAHPDLHIHGRVVHLPRERSVLPHCVLPLRVLHDRALPDGHVHPRQDRQRHRPEHALDHSRHLSRTIPIHIQYLQGSYGHVDLGAVMALIMMSVIPIIVFYLTCQKYIVSGVMAGAVKG